MIGSPGSAINTANLGAYKSTLPHFSSTSIVRAPHWPSSLMRWLSEFHFDLPPSMPPRPPVAESVPQGRRGARRNETAGGEGAERSPDRGNCPVVGFDNVKSQREKTPFNRLHSEGLKSNI
ncbi:hypothetical protein EVAR_82045_1 [Eumeta japonica]|uniref:Uncharacterized protein n=1 Tax=Eumeta variegata TaxID=151549 RepID=A0A4C1XN85_EUMVA|nr:hypothetical protein EVAR_82045_1 [Eumeta japonica]